MTWTNLSEMNHALIKHVAAEFLHFDTSFEDSRDYNLKGTKAGRLLELLRKAGTTRYLSGPAAKSYIPEDEFSANGIEVEWMDYGGYPEYPQFHPPFEHAVSVIDLLFHTGPEASAFLKQSAELT